MDDDKSNLEGRSNVAEDLRNTAANSFSREANETLANQHDGVQHLPPPPSYSEAIASTAQHSNQPGMHYPVQQQGYPPMYPGGPQQPQFELGGFTPQGGTLNPDEIPQRIESSSVITENNVVQQSWRPCLIRLFISFMFVGILVLIILGIRYLTA